MIMGKNNLGDKEAVRHFFRALITSYMSDVAYIHVENQRHKGKKAMKSPSVVFVVFLVLGNGLHSSV